MANTSYLNMMLIRSHLGRQSVCYIIPPGQASDLAGLAGLGLACAEVPEGALQVLRAAWTASA